MLVKNIARRLITLRSGLVVTKDEKGKVIGATEGKNYRVLPAGPAVDIPQELFESKYVQQLIKDKDLEVIVVDGNGADADDDELETLKAEADELGVEYGANIGIDTLRKRVEAARG